MTPTNIALTELVVYLYGHHWDLFLFIFRNDFVRTTSYTNIFINEPIRHISRDIIVNRKCDHFKQITLNANKSYNVIYHDYKTDSSTILQLIKHRQRKTLCHMLGLLTMNFRKCICFSLIFFIKYTTMLPGELLVKPLSSLLIQWTQKQVFRTNVGWNKCINIDFLSRDWGNRYLYALFICQCISIYENNLC